MTFVHVLFALLGITCGFFLGWMALSARIARGSALLEAAHNDKKSLSDALDNVSRERASFHERAVRLEMEKKALEQRLAEQQEQLRVEFHNTANTILKNVSNEFSTQSEKKIGDLLNPLRERLGEFQKKVDESFSAHGKEQHTLKSEIEKIVKTNDSLAKALRGDIKAQGNWGEFVLERILEASGLRFGEDYIVQGSEMGLSGAEGNRLKPDIVVRLPDNKHIVIDSKVSLTAYDRYCGQPEDIHLKDFLKSVRAHVAGLEQKRYQDIDKLGTPDFVFMFMPIEGAFSFAMQQDPELQDYSWGKGIQIVPPSNLLSALRMVASLWRIEQQNKNAQEIARQAGRLYDKFAAFIDDMKAIGSKLIGVQKTYDEAMNKLADGRDNLLRQTEKLKTLGAKTSKSLSKEILGDDDDQKVIALVQSGEENQ